MNLGPIVQSNTSYDISYRKSHVSYNGEVISYKMHKVRCKKQEKFPIFAP